MLAAPIPTWCRQDHELHDALESVLALSGHAGSVEETFTYQPFGGVLTHWGETPNALRYTGRELDADTGLYYYRARYYDPDLGGFLSQDPLGFGGGDVNLYAYAGNNPLIASDPDGLVQQHTELSGVRRVLRELADIPQGEISAGYQLSAKVSFLKVADFEVGLDLGTGRTSWNNTGYSEAGGALHARRSLFPLGPRAVASRPPSKDGPQSPAAQPRMKVLARPTSWVRWVPRRRPPPSPAVLQVDM